MSVDPFATNWLGFLIFYGILFLALIGSFTLFGVTIRKVRMANPLIFHVVLLSFRQAVVLSFFVILLLVLQSAKILKWWVMILLAAVVIAIEVFVLARERKNYPVLSEAELEKDDAFESIPVFEKKKIDNLDQIIEESVSADIEINFEVES